MSVVVHEGLPGCGKTLRMLSLIEGFLEQKRSVYLFNFKLSDKGIAHFTALAEKNGVGFYVRPDRPADLHVALEVDPGTGYASLKSLGIEDGATIIFDEGQEFFKSRGMSKEPTPPFVAMLPTHRHSGYNVHFITQNIMYLDIEIRRICDNYIKYSRLMNWDRCRLDVYGGIKDNPLQQNQVLLERGQTFRYPKHIFELYTSSVDHNMKSRFPTRLKWLIVLIFIIFTLLYVAYYSWSSMMGGITGSASRDSKLPTAPSSPAAADPSRTVKNTPSSPSAVTSPATGSPRSNRHSDSDTGSVETYLGVGRPSVPDITEYDIYYSGYFAEFTPHENGKGYSSVSIPIFNLLRPDGSCSRVTEKFFSALGLAIIFDREFAVIYNAKERIRHVLPITASPCVTRYASTDSQSTDSNKSGSSKSGPGSRPVQVLKPSNTDSAPRSAGNNSSSYSFPSNPDSAPR